MLVSKELVAWWVKYYSLRLHVLFNQKKKNNNNQLNARLIKKGYKKIVYSWKSSELKSAE